METRPDRIKRLRATWGNKCVFCAQDVDQDACPMSVGVAHQRCSTAAAADAEAAWQGAPQTVKDRFS